MDDHSVHFKDSVLKISLFFNIQIVSKENGEWGRKILDKSYFSSYILYNYILYNFAGGFKEDSEK